MIPWRCGNLPFFCLIRYLLIPWLRGQQKGLYAPKGSRTNSQYEQNKSKPFWKQGLYYYCSAPTVLLLFLRCLPSSHLSWCVMLRIHRQPVLPAIPDDGDFRVPVTTYCLRQLPNNIPYNVKVVCLPTAIPYSTVHTSCLHFGAEFWTKSQI